MTPMVLPVEYVLRSGPCCRCGTRKNIPKETHCGAQSDAHPLAGSALGQYPGIHMQYGARGY
jgi:hypothetical protein